MKLLRVGTIVLAAAAATALAGDMPWAKDWASAQKMAKSSGKLVMLDFYAVW